MHVNKNGIAFGERNGERFGKKILIMEEVV